MSLFLLKSTHPHKVHTLTQSAFQTHLSLTMATNSLQSLHHHHHPLIRRHHTDAAPAAARPTNPNTLSSLSLSLSSSSSTTTANGSVVAFSLSTSTTSSSQASTTTSTDPISFDLLEQHLQAQDFRQADEETRRLLIALAGEAAVKRGYVFFSEVNFIAEADLRAVDELWKQHSDGKFGYSVQKKIWEKVNKDFTNFFIRVGWMKLLDTEVVQHNYRAFPNEFIWENGKETPQGHLPLTNALRGTQLLSSIFNHPAFEGKQDEDEQDDGIDSGNGASKTKPLSKTAFKADYSF